MSSTGIQLYYVHTYMHKYICVTAGHSTNIRLNACTYQHTAQNDLFISVVDPGIISFSCAAHHAPEGGIQPPHMQKNARSVLRAQNLFFTCQLTESLKSTPCVLTALLGDLSDFTPRPTFIPVSPQNRSKGAPAGSERYCSAAHLLSRSNSSHTANSNPTRNGLL